MEGLGSNRLHALQEKDSREGTSGERNLNCCFHSKAAAFTIVSPTQINAVSPAHAAGAITVAVTR